MRRYPKLAVVSGLTKLARRQLVASPEIYVGIRGRRSSIVRDEPCRVRVTDKDKPAKQGPA